MERTVVSFKVEGKEVSFMTSNEHAPLVMKALLKRVKDNAKVEKWDIPTAEEVYNEIKQSDNTSSSSNLVKCKVEKSWYQKVSKKYIVCIRVLLGSNIEEYMYHRPIGHNEALYLKSTVTKANSIDLQYWQSL